MADKEIKTVLNQAGSCQAAFDEVIDCVHRAVAAIDRLSNVKGDWNGQVALGKIGEGVPKLIEDLVPEKDLSDLRAALVLFRDKHQEA